MKVTIPTLGGAALSLSGRDKGRLYIIIGVNENEILVCDGKYRKLENPKKKNVKHVRLLPEFFPEIAKRAGEGKDENSEIRAALKQIETRQQQN